ncbi:MAG: class I SAM-dependent methyltransferase [Ilumatobacter sp.]|nr:class I SAM-dependent methyltransferase [Ilumatobacter sp.]
MSEPEQREQELTDAAFWEREWSQVESHPALVSTDYAPHLYGERGLYTRVLQRHLGSCDGVRVLEFGAGGPNMHLLALSKYLHADVAGIDYSPASLDQLTRLFELHGEPLHAIEGDFFTHDFGDDRFDLIVHWGVAEHFVDLVPFLRRCRELLAPGGEMLFTMPNLEGIARATWSRWSPENWSKHILHTEADVSAAADRAGFAVKSHFRFGIPFVGPQSYEDTGRPAMLVAYLQRALARLPKVVPIFHAHGSRLLAGEQGFHLTQLETPPPSSSTP